MNVCLSAFAVSSKRRHWQKGSCSSRVFFINSPTFFSYPWKTYTHMNLYMQTRNKQGLKLRWIRVSGTSLLGINKTRCRTITCVPADKMPTHFFRIRFFPRQFSSYFTRIDVRSIRVVFFYFAEMFFESVDEKNNRFMTK